LVAVFTQQKIRELLVQVAHGNMPVEQALNGLRNLPFEELSCATLDHHRHLRDGFGEVVYCQGKTPDQVAQIMSRSVVTRPQLLGTRATLKQFEAAQALVPQLQYHELARAIWLDLEPDRPRLPGILVAAAGTSDMPVAEEATLTLRLMGHEPQCITDVGIAGLHRLLCHRDALHSANVIVAVAGMEGALPSVVGGLVSAPVIAVPTSVGYGASFQGLAALLGMLNSCAAGVAVVNIDNGFGAGYLAAMINRKIEEAKNQSDAPA